jgi:hypothetical protein
MSGRKRKPSKPSNEVLDFHPEKKLPSLRKWAFIGLILIVSRTVIGMAKSGHDIPTVPSIPVGHSKITVSTNSTGARGNSGGTSSSTASTVTWVHGTASMGRVGLAQTIAFDGNTPVTTSVNFDTNSINFSEYGTYLPNGTYYVQIWQDSIPSDTRPDCNAIPSPFIVSGQANIAQNFVCQ